MSDVAPPSWFARYRDTSPILALHRLVSLLVLYQLYSPRWIHVITHDVMCFLFGSLVPNGPLFRALAGTSIAFSTSPLSAGQGVTGYCSPKWGHLTNSPSVCESSLPHMPVDSKTEGTLLINVAGRRVGFEAERVKEKEWVREFPLIQLLFIEHPLCASHWQYSK